MNYFRILRLMQHGDKRLFDVTLKEQQLFLVSLGEPKDDIDRSFKQYQCQNYFVPTWKVWLLNILAAVIVPIMVGYFIVKGLFIRKDTPIYAIIENKGMDEVVPSVVREKYKPDNNKWRKGASMRVVDIGFLLKLIHRAPHHPYFVLKAWMNVVQYSEMIRKYSPKVLIEFGEFSFSSSILTAYCHRYGVKHINIMHGEKIWYIRDAYFHFDECYVWDEHYVNIFRELKAEPSQFIVAVPESIHIDTKKYKNDIVYSDYKYYLGIYSETELQSIIKSMAFIKREGKSVKYRPHPRYSDLTVLKKYVNDNEIEMPSKVGILESISNMEYAVGSFSTVLSQAYFSGKKVILDDINFESEYKKLKESKYILSSKNTIKLSELQT